MSLTPKTDSLPPRDVLQKFLLGFEGTFLPDDLRQLLAGGLGGVALYPRNFKTTEGLRALTADVRRAAGRPVLIGIDQEGGTKFSLPEPFTPWVSPEELGQLNDATAVEEQAVAMARELRAVGINLNFAPMLDLHLNPDSPVTKGRSFGSDPQRVSRLGAAFIRGMDDGGVLACAKHFPGHGDTTTDPHEDLPVFQGTVRQLESSHLLPFDAAIGEGVLLVMTAHILLPQIAPDHPASLSRKLLTDVLRERMEYKGVILADDLGMGAIANRYGIGDAAVMALQAGCDMLMLCHDWSLVQPAIEKVAEARSRGDFAENEWETSQERSQLVQRVLWNLDESYGWPGINEIGCSEHHKLAEELRLRAAMQS